MNANFGEELVYWYLRLNGFFLINNFVLHQNSEGRTSDADLLAVRLPYVYEETGGRLEDWDPLLLSYFEPGKTIGIICEVKTGLNFNTNKIFQDYNVNKSVQRIGFTSNELDYQEIFDNSMVSFGDYQIAKLLVTRKLDNPKSDCLHIKMVHIRSFLRERMHKYMDRKLGDRMFFSSSLLQYLIWDESLKMNR
ncbi:hypothetical protein QYF52_00380 [Paenibacillus polymyxa]|uniref:hypothetical protein n=1 Tax=Paenibacillus TaxID=44249 RepID=UPI00046F49C1|nr:MULTISPECIES: hypothetical protein [Paenibacillus]MBY7737111.1 hypothetical protein [Paenibacillus polymyxa]MDN4076372.1 hypothetical protein [Paenibacillus polymyxa]MDN4101798.1 hypothetical protein [Paenibacillus polymyxa]MDN4112015.1 hypothetical protein [Paenibacillus polymyxa]PNQ78843.1 hypothetical protein C1T21_22605 [Paenibacillus sp. F4]